MLLFISATVILMALVLDVNRRHQFLFFYPMLVSIFGTLNPFYIIIRNTRMTDMLTDFVGPPINFLFGILASMKTPRIYPIYDFMFFVKQNVCV
jgi:hypothetical protein